MKDMTRRTFLKAGVAFSSLVLAEAVLAGGRMEQWLDDGFVALRDGRFLQVKATTCTECFAGCGIVGFLDRGKAVSLQGNPLDPNSRGKICAKGLGGLTKPYDSGRILWPLKRSGRRGEGNWERVSWDSALQEIIAKLEPITKFGGREVLVFDEGGETDAGIVQEFLHAFGGSVYLNRSGMERANRSAACSAALGENFLVPDIARSKFVLHFGANPYEHHEYYVPLLQRLVDNRVENGLKMVTFDVRLTNTAAKSDQWIPCSPGSDGFLAAAMAGFILRNELHDKDFVNKWLTCSEDELRSHLAQFTLADAERVSGVKREVIEGLALEFGSQKPAVAISGNGVGRHANGAYQESAILLLNAITGNIDAPGGLCLPRDFRLPLSGTNLPGGSCPDVGTLFSGLRNGDFRISAYVDHKANPAYSTAGCGTVQRVLADEKTVPFLVVIDTHMTETANLADLVLPAASGLEEWGLLSRPSLNFVPQLNLVQPLVQPPGEAREIGEILIGIAEKMGGEVRSGFPFLKPKDYVACTVSHFPELVASGGLKRLCHEGLWFDPSTRPAFKTFEDVKFKTPSGKYEVFSKTFPADRGYLLSALSPPKRTPGTLVLVLCASGLLSPSNAGCKWLTEIVHENRLWIHPEIAADLELGNADRVEVSSESGSLRVRVGITSGIRPGVVALSSGFGHKAYGNRRGSNPVAAEDPDLNLIWWNPDPSDVNVNILLPLLADHLPAGQVSKNIEVRLKKC